VKCLKAPSHTFIEILCAHVNNVSTKNKQRLTLSAHETQCFYWSIDFQKNLPMIGSMSQPKEQIPIESIRKLAEVLACLHQSTAKAVADFDAAGLEAADVEGWRTLHRGLVYTQRIVKKLTGPADPVQKLDTTAILLDQHKKKLKRKAEKAEDMAKLNEAAEKVREIRKRKPKSP
jgi:hypothetical protein